MRINSILAVVAVTLAAKVSAECFAKRLGYSCCTTTKEVVSIDPNGKWGIENGHICGIEEKLNVSSSEGKVSIEKRESIWKTYMNKVKITEFCPPEFLERKDGVEYPAIENISYYSTTTQSERPLVVVLPPNYNEKKKYPVVYILHGIMTDGSFMLQEGFGTVTIPGNLFHKHMAKEFIMVLPNQYAPAPGTEVEPNLNEEYFAGYNNFINDLVNDIMPYMKKHYSIATGKKNTAICGYSFGGRNSLYIGLKRPDLFGYVGSFSPAPGILPGDDVFTGHHNGLFKEEKDVVFAGKPPYLTMISCGTNDTVVGTFPKSYHEALTHNNQQHIWYEMTGLDHADDAAINSPYYNFFSSIFGQVNKKGNKVIKDKTRKVVKTKTKKINKVQINTKKVKVTKTKKIVNEKKIDESKYKDY
ncbi:alpha/beta-hydrolase [Neocallimastix lanati (nom. inval.)]|jgi:enterochelin esterase-like enzyme|uniref:Alpha/beta-hydrolase n=1 Tax=Neocallimastix californiae TaxID=1754190 RepID=A0A1Y2EP77_9FUNG|nr:alpha/beta-hydrolase [Neocallimastix sp. JGI-2020a]ORY73328.1 alpha/beta-hydrolase [Neocallimastix californiae]|eukprot:ORY73328.1 alpha/beta-hydrolase [Neocallimastix californiae]